MKEIDLGPVPDHCTCPNGDFRHCHGQTRSLELQIEDIKKKCVVGGMPVSGLICLPTKDVERFMRVDAEHDVSTGRVIRMTDALNKIHDLAGQMGDHPHVGAIQAWVHKVLPCEEKRVVPVPRGVACDCTPADLLEIGCNFSLDTVECQKCKTFWDVPCLHG